MKRIDINIGRTADFIDNHLQKVKKNPDNSPPISRIEIGINSRCNRRCVFCPRFNEKDFPNIQESFNLELFKKMINDLSTINYSGKLTFSGFGEPLLTQNITEYIRYAKEKCPDSDIEIVSNGDLLTTETLKGLFDAGLSEILISLYEGKHQKELFKKMAEKLGLSDAQVVLRERYLSPEEGYGLTISNRAGNVKLKEGKLDVGPLTEPLKQPCNYPFFSMMVDFDGKVLLCSSDWQKELILGDLNKQSIFKIWNGKKFNEARKKLINKDRKFSPCNLCDTNGTYNGELHLEAWRRYFDGK